MKIKVNYVDTRNPMVFGQYQTEYLSFDLTPTTKNIYNVVSKWERSHPLQVRALSWVLQPGYIR